MKSKLLIVGGFLGAGKTSLLREAAQLVKSGGGKVGLITNDQAAELVDTSFLEMDGDIVREVAGSCFCCNFGGFAEAVAAVAHSNVGGVILAEPVGSCTDLSATLLQPLKDKFADSIDLAPLTVLADPHRLRDILFGVPSASAYIARKQFEEADILLINKTDLISAEELSGLIADAESRWPGVKVMSASVKSGLGIREWLSAVMEASAVGTRLAEVDYDIYASGEAAYGWLNGSFVIERPSDELGESARQFLAALGARFDSAGLEVGHVKFLLRTGKKDILGNLIGKSDTSVIREFEGSPGEAILTVNARVETAPETLQAIVLEEVSRAFRNYGYTQTALRCLIPGRPSPTYRYKTVQ